MKRYFKRYAGEEAVQELIFKSSIKGKEKKSGKIKE